jgi:hypothetical protein
MDVRLVRGRSTVSEPNQNTGPKRPSEKTLKRLFGESGNLCAFPKCRQPIIIRGTVTGKVCHIKAKSPDGPRYDPAQSDDERHGYENLILLCGKHHDVVDDDEASYTVERLRQIKLDHLAQAAPLSEEDVEQGGHLLFYSPSCVSSINQYGGITAGSVEINPVHMHVDDYIINNFYLNAVPPVREAPGTPTLGSLAALVGKWTGFGLRTILRPDYGDAARDSILEMALTSESLTFSPSQPAPSVSYVQTTEYLTNAAQPEVAHVESGRWMIVPPAARGEGEIVTRLMSIPYAKAILAQGRAFEATPGRPIIRAMDVKPFVSGSIPPKNVKVRGQTNANIPQAMLDDPNTLLRDDHNCKVFRSFNTIFVSDPPIAPRAGWWDDQQRPTMAAVFWIETVETAILVPIFKPGQPPLVIKGNAGVPTFSVRPPWKITEPQVMAFRFTQIQYSQVVLLNSNGITWPIAAVATLLPAEDIVVPKYGWE